MIAALHNFISKNIEVLDFVKKYCWQNELGPMFVDFIFGEFSAYGEMAFPIILHNNEIINSEDFHFYNHVFIKKIELNSFKTSLQNVTQILQKGLECI